MTKILLIEDELPAREKLKLLIRDCLTGNIEFSECSSLKEARISLAEKPTPDLIFMDILLSDGCSMDLLENSHITAPVVFTTAYEDYWARSFEANGIDYILKPYGKGDIQSALDKYHKLNRHFLQKNNLAANSLQRQRILVRKGLSFMSLELSEIAYFYTEHKLTMLKDNQGNRYMIDRTLSDLENELNNHIFFRFNRQFLGNISAIRNFKPHSKGRLLLSLQPSTEEEVVISQENAGRFKKWMDGLLIPTE